MQRRAESRQRIQEEKKRMQDIWEKAEAQRLQNRENRLQR
jgi:hypothetical protein